MDKFVLLREYLRVLRRVRLRPSTEGQKKLEYLRFINAHLCPECEEEVGQESYFVQRNEEGLVQEIFRCQRCGLEYSFPIESIH